MISVEDIPAMKLREEIEKKSVKRVAISCGLLSVRQSLSLPCSYLYAPCFRASSPSEEINSSPCAYDRRVRTVYSSRIHTVLSTLRSAHSPGCSFDRPKPETSTSECAVYFLMLPARLSFRRCARCPATRALAVAGERKIRLQYSVRPTEGTY